MKVPEITRPSSLFAASARYKAPVFQRYYVWGKTEWTSLTEDIETADAEIGQFLGAIVLKDLGRLSGPTSPTTYLLIDGQQRLTTLYLLLLGLAAQANDHESVDDATYIWRNHLAEVKSPQYNGLPKLVPTLQDRHTFYEILGDALPDMEWDFSADPEEKKPRESRKLRSQWTRIQKYITSATEGEGDGEFDKSRFDALLRRVQDDFRLIAITLEEFDDANATFSRLNAKGVPLGLGDLIRNEIFSKFGAKDSGKADAFFLKSWQPFEKSIPDGTLDAFFPIYAYIALKGKVTKAAAFAELQKLWQKKPPGTILSELQRYSGYFSSLSQFTAFPGLSARMNSQVERFSSMPRTRVTWPFLIQVLRAVEDGKLDEKDALKSLKIVESFLVRRALVGREPTGLHAVFKTLWERTKGRPNDVLEKIVSRTILSPSDVELASFLKKEPSDTRVILPYVLKEYEGYIVRENGYDPANKTVATVEHVLPRNLAAGWTQFVSAADHGKTFRLIGNLVPLSEKQNKSLQDQAWSEKRKRFRGSNFKSAQNLARKQTWTHKEIEARTGEVIKWITSNWKELDRV